MLEEKQGARARRDWHQLHLAVDAGGFTIVANTLTVSQTGDPSQVGPLLSQTDNTISEVTANGDYDGRPVYNTIAGYGERITVVMPPHSTTMAESTTGPPCQRDRHLALIQEKGWQAWQKASGYEKWALVEAIMSCWKRLLVPASGRAVLRHRKRKRQLAWRY